MLPKLKLIIRPRHSGFKGREFMSALRMTILALVSCGLANLAIAQYTNPNLYGRWKNIEAKVFKADGTTSTQTAECVLEIFGDQAISECVLPGGSKARSVSRIV